MLHSVKLIICPLFSTFFFPFFLSSLVSFCGVGCARGVRVGRASAASDGYKGQVPDPGGGGKNAPPWIFGFGTSHDTVSYVVESPVYI